MLILFEWWRGMRRFPKVKVERFPSYRGLEWDKNICDPNHPNFWKYAVANLTFLDYVKDKKLVLDLGCGTGGSTFFLAKHGKAEWIVGVDLARDMIRVAKKNATNRRLDQKTCFIVCDGRYLPFKALCFEALISRGDVFCFLVPLKDTVQELKRIMKPKGVMLLEMDNRVDWKAGTIVSTGFRKTLDGKIAYVVETFTTKRNHRSISYILDPEGEIAKKLAVDREFEEKGCKECKGSLQKIKQETIEVRRSVATHWPTVRELFAMFRKSSFVEVQVIGDGLLMELLLNGDEVIIRAMNKNPELFFEIEKRLIPYIDPNKAPTIILRAVAP
jgi:ubiquinone/menaquinone biosynthesis C-methylase UbiE